MKIHRRLTLPPVRLTRDDLDQLVERSAQLVAEGDRVYAAQLVEDAKHYYETQPEQDAYVERTMEQHHMLAGPLITLRTRHGRVEGNVLDDLLATAEGDGIEAIELSADGDGVRSEVILRPARQSFALGSEVEVRGRAVERVTAELAWYEHFFARRVVWWRRITGNGWFQFAVAVFPIVVLYGIAFVFKGIRVPIWVGAFPVAAPLVALGLARVSPPLEIEGITPQSWVQQNMTAILVGIVSSLIVSALFWIVSTITTR